MRKHLRDIVFTVVIIAASLFFAAVSPFFADEEQERERLAPIPEIRLADGSFNPRFTDDVTKYFADHFAFRNVLIDLNSKLITGVFKTSPVSDVIYGKDGWLFFEDTLDDYLKTNLMTRREFFSAARTLYLIQEYAESCGARFLFAPIPNKNTVYGEYMPYEAVGGDSNYTLLIAELERQGVGFLDMSSLLKKEEAITYYKSDTHWNMLGAAIAADAINQSLERESDFEDSMLLTGFLSSGDLYEMIFPASSHSEPDYEPGRAFTFEYTTPFRTEEDIRIGTKKENTPGSLVMFRDSFGNSLYSFMAESYGEALFSRMNNYQLDLINRQSANYLVIELVERNLDYLLKYAPIFPAPEREDIGNPEKRLNDCTIQIEALSDLQGFVKISGSIADDGLDVGSPVYVQTDGRVFEATPQGFDGAGYTFALYLPEAYMGKAFVIVANTGDEPAASVSLLS